MANKINTTTATETAEVKLTDAQALDRYFELQAMIEELTKESDALKAQLKAATATEDDRKLVLNGHKLTIRTQSKTSISYNEVVKVHPRLAKKFGKTTTYDVFTIR
jgi:predicted phage-related endonuclease